MLGPGVCKVGIPTVVLLRELHCGVVSSYAFPPNILSCPFPCKLPHKTTHDLWDQKMQLEGLLDCLLLSLLALCLLPWASTQEQAWPADPPVR